MPTRLVSAPWATADDIDALVPGRPTPVGGWEPWLAQASDLLYQLTGRQWRGPATSKVQIVPAGADETLRRPVPGWVPVPADSGGFGTWARWGRQSTVVALPSSPVTTVLQVLLGDPHGTGVDATELDPTCWRLRDRAGHLERLDGQPWPDDGGLFVSYRHGIAPPAGGTAAAATLAVELANAGPGGDGTSRLANTATITREGVTLAAVDLRAAITGGLTGLPEVDLWITSVNPKKLARRGGAWTPDHADATRIPVPVPASPYPGVQPMALTFGTPAHPAPTTTDVQRRAGRRRARRTRAEE